MDFLEFPENDQNNQVRSLVDLVWVTVDITKKNGYEVLLSMSIIPTWYLLFTTIMHIQ